MGLDPDSATTLDQDPDPKQWENYRRFTTAFIIAVPDLRICIR